MGVIIILTNEELEILLKEYDFEDYKSITAFFNLMKSDYLKYLKVWNNASSEDKPGNEKKFYLLLKNEYFSKYLVEKIKDTSISNKFLPKNPTNTALPFLLYFCVYFKKFKCPKNDFYVAYLFNKDLSKVFLTLILGSDNEFNCKFNHNLLGGDLEQTKFNFKDFINDYKSDILSELNINLENYDDEIFLDRFEDGEVSQLGVQNSKALSYEQGSIYVKSYEMGNLPSEEDLLKDFNNFIKLYDFIIKKLFDENDGPVESNINFEEALKIVKSVLKENGTTIDEDYDMLLVKKLPPADIINQNKQSRGNTTHIALTGEKMDLFPYLESYDYFYNGKGEYDTNSKVRFLLDVPVNLYSSNLNYLGNMEFNDEDVKIHTTVTVVRNRKNDRSWSLDKFKSQIDDLADDDYKRRIKLLGYEVQAELSSNYSGEEFKEFRKLLYENYYLIILKYEKEFKYDVFAVRPGDGEEMDSIDYQLFALERKTVALISSNAWSTFDDSSEEYYHPLWSKQCETDEIKFGGENLLVYGVPGSGKSWYIKNEKCKDVDEECIERVVFHPDYTYSDFVGQILPNVSEGNVSYDFTEGPFTSILIKACANPNKHFYLIIEEINRGNAPAIFGDIFQLLDRRDISTEDMPIGTSEYAITNFDIADKVYNDMNHKIRIPCNLSIIATMNTSDQNVFTLDTAFQRRWDMKLIPNKFNKGHEFAGDKILESDVTWRQFVDNINELILENNTLITSSEDKRLGAYFVQKQDLKDSEKFSQKVLKYLWDDAFKFSRDDIFSDECKSLEQLIDKFNDNEGNSRFDIFENKEFIVLKDDDDRDDSI